MADKQQRKQKNTIILWIFLICIVMSIVGPFLIHPTQMESTTTEMERKVDELFHKHVESTRKHGNSRIIRDAHEKIVVIDPDDYRIEDNKLHRTLKEPPARVVHKDEASSGRQYIRQADNDNTAERTTIWKNSYNMVHVIYSRFMQNQPNLLQLGKARLELFKTFCLPTITRQTNQEFLWIIRTDPDLHPTLRNGLLETLKGIHNVAVVGSNEIKKGSIDGGFRGPSAIEDITSESLLFGDYNLIRSFHRATRNRTVLETNLDADDGLALTFVERAQNLTAGRFLHTMGRQDAWLNLCVGRHLEWQYFAPWDMKTDRGSMDLGKTHVCITPGLSWASQENAKPRWSTAHHLIKKKLPSCLEVKKRFGCWLEIPTEHPRWDVTAIRARTPTSTGMSRVVLSETEWTKEQKDTDKESWPLLEEYFAIKETTIRAAHQYLNSHIQEMVEENLKGQCTKDHSCSEGIKKKLKNLIFKSDKWVNKHGLVHIIQTTVDVPEVFDVLSNFCFSSLDAQSTYEFLWIIRVKSSSNDEEDSKLIRGIVKHFQKSGLNIILVKSDQSPTVGFRDPVSIRDIINETIAFGDYSVLEEYHNAARDHMLLETFLPPNAALNKTFVEGLQRSSVDQVKESMLQDDENAWFYRCHSEYVGWDYFPPTGEDLDAGFLKLVKLEGRNCVESPATTRISLPKAKSTYTKEAQGSECQTFFHVLKIQSGCFFSVASDPAQTALVTMPESIEKPEPTNIAENDLDSLEEQDGVLRTLLRDTFNIYPYTIEAMRKRIRDGHCGNSCTDQYDNDYGVVHVIHTSLYDVLQPSMFDVWRKFCFSLELQTTTKFLWVIRIADEAKLIKNVLKPINKTPLNIILVKSNYTPVIDFRRPEAVADITNEAIVKGDLKTLQYFHQSAQSRPLLETFLKPNEAVAKTFVDYIQNSSSIKIEQNHIQEGAKSWFYHSEAQYIEWNYFDPRGDVTEAGFLRLLDSKNQTFSQPALTLVSLPGSNVVIDYKKTAAQVCRTKIENGCVVQYISNETQSARAVIPQLVTKTKKVDIDEREYILLEKEDQNLRKFLKEMFGIFPVSLKAMRSKIEADAVGTIENVWRNRHNIVHVIFSRFMQHQAQLLDLGMIRLELFKTFTLPSLAQQTNKQFLWIIRTDPDLHPKLRRGLINALDGMPNAVVVGSNLGVDGAHQGGFRSPEGMNEFKSGSLFYGDLKMVESFHTAAKDRTLLETNFDSDDAFSLTFIENAQAITVERFQADHKKDGWLNLCLGPYIEWHFYAPWAKHSDTGCIIEGLTRTCVKSGISWATQPNAIPQFIHEPHMVKEKAPACTLNRTVDNYLHHGCWEEVPQQNEDVMAIHAMTPASMGLARGEVSSFDWNIESLSYDKEAWSFLEPFFAMRIESVKDVRKSIIDNMDSVVEDRDRSKCTHDRTCMGKWKNDFRVVHVVYTSVQDGNAIELTRRATFASIMGGHTYQFLWIVRVKDFADYRLTLALLDDFAKSPLNLILVKSDYSPQVDFRSRQALADINNETVLFGDLQILNHYHRAAQDRILLETFLGPTDSLPRNFFPTLQNSTVVQLERHGIKQGQSSWYYQCVSDYIEFDYITPRGKEKETGFYNILGRDKNCINHPGTTRASLPGSQIDKSMEEAQECPSGAGMMKNGCFIHMSPGIDSPDGTMRTAHIVPPDKHISKNLTEESIQDLERKQFLFKKTWRAFAVVPMRLKKLKKALAENERKIVHVIHTSLQDPSLTTAFRHFCIDSLQMQSVKRFLWIVRVNGDFDERQLYPILYQFSTNHEKGHLDAIVVKSNHTPAMDFRSPEGIADINEETLLHGDLEIVKDYHMAAGGRTLMETFLHPTNGLAKTFTASLQESILDMLKQSEIEDGPNAWFYQCAPGYIEWTYFTPRGDDSDNGFFRTVTPDQNHCIHGPATTRVSLPESKMIDQKNDFVTEKCSSDPAGKKSGCFLPMVFMKNETARAVVPESLDNQVVEDLTESEFLRLSIENLNLTTRLNDVFEISPYSVEIMRKNILERLCSDGRECNFRWDSKYGVVHVVQTSLQHISMFDYWRNFCFALESQSTTDFLWILRVGPDPKLIKMILKPIHKTPLNILVVKSNYTPNVDFRNPQAIADITKESLQRGKLEILNHYHEKSQSSPLLETFLDVTEAVAMTFVEDLQQSTANQLKQQLPGSNPFYYRCVPEHIEWNYFNPLGKEKSQGFLKVISKEQGNCLDRPGLTRISLPVAKLADVELKAPSSRETKECNSKKKGGLTDGCYLPIESDEIQSARLIIPDSIDPIINPNIIIINNNNNITERDLERLTNEDTDLQLKLRDNFKIYPILLRQTQKSIKKWAEKAKEDQA